MLTVQRYGKHCSTPSCQHPFIKKSTVIKDPDFIWLQCFYFIEFIYSSIHLEIFPEKKPFYLNLTKSFSFCKLMLTYTGVYNFPHLLSLLDSSCPSIGLVAIKTLIIYMSKWMINNTTVFGTQLNVAQYENST